VGANNRIAGHLARHDGELAELLTADGWRIQARKSGTMSVGDAVVAFVRPEVANLEREAQRLPGAHARYVGEVQSLLFDGANSAVLLSVAQSRFEFRVALPQTGRLADLKVGEKVYFSFDPERAICFAGANAAAVDHG